MNAISRAEDYKKDKQPMSDVKQLAQEKMESLKEDMKFANKDIDKLSNDELVSADKTLDNMLQNYKDKIANQRERHLKLNPPIGQSVNPTFVETSNAVKDEMVKRGIK